MKWIPEDVPAAIIWIFAITLCLILLSVVVQSFFGERPSEQGYAILSKLINVILAAIMLYIGTKIKR